MRVHDIYKDNSGQNMKQHCYTKSTTKVYLFAANDPSDSKVSLLLNSFIYLGSEKKTYDVGPRFISFESLTSWEMIRPHMPNVNRSENTFTNVICDIVTTSKE